MAIRRATWWRSRLSSSAPQQQLERLAAETADLGHHRHLRVCGTRRGVDREAGHQQRRRLERGNQVFRQNKMLLPTYDVFDEARYFDPADRESLTIVRGAKTALTICEDAWNDKQYWERRLYERDPVEELTQSGAEILISINASPYHMHKRDLRREIFTATARRYNVPLVYVNQVGGNDQLVFDGSSFAMNAQGEVIASAKSFAEDLVFVDTAAGTGRSARGSRRRMRGRV